MTTQERTGLFGTADPRDILLNKVLEEMPRERQTEYITLALQEKRVWDYAEKDATPLVEALEQLFEGQGTALRAHLIELCNAIPMQIEGDRHYSEQIEVAASLRLAMFVCIIEGWGWEDSRPFGNRRLQRDAQTCFYFLCESYKTAPRYQRDGNYPNIYAERGEGKLRKGILQLFRDYLDPTDTIDRRHKMRGVRYGHWDAGDLDPWILNKGVPEDIALVLVKARVRLGGLALARAEIAALHSQ